MNALLLAGLISALDARIKNDASEQLFAPGQEVMLRVQLDAARKAVDANDPNAQSMVDVIDRQLAAVDHILSRAENGQVLVVHVGDDVTIAMRDGNDYSVQMSDPSALMRQIGVMFARGVQGVFSAKKATTVTITLTNVLQNNGCIKYEEPIRFTVVILT